MTIEHELNILTNSYSRHGGKDNRRQQIKRIRAICKWIDEHHRVGSIRRIGKKHLIDFWRNHRHLSAATLLRGYYPAARQLWKMLNKIGKPPEPLIFSDTNKE